MVRLLAAVARGRVDGVVRRSTTRDSTPWRASAIAAVSPPGPAPTTRTGTCVAAPLTWGCILVFTVISVVLIISSNTLSFTRRDVK